MENQIQVGVIGLGRAGEKHALTYERLPFVHLKAVCDIDANRVLEFCKIHNTTGYTDYLELLGNPEIDAVSIVLPDDLHRNVTLDAIRHNKHILLEKPIAAMIEDGREILDAAKGYQKTFMVAHLLRYDPRYTLARDSVLDGDIGDILYITSRRNSTYGSAIKYSAHTDTHIHLMIHDADYINWVMRSRPVKVYAKSREVLLKDSGMRDAIIAIVEYENGAIANLEACWVLPDNSPAKLDDRMEIVGTKGTVYIQPCSSGIQIVSQSSVLYPDAMYWPMVNNRVGGTFLDELTSFIECVSEGKKPVCGAVEAYGALQVVDGIARSLKEGGEVGIPYHGPS